MTNEEKAAEIWSHWYHEYSLRKEITPLITEALDEKDVEITRLVGVLQRIAAMPHFTGDCDLAPMQIARAALAPKLEGETK